MKTSIYSKIGIALILLGAIIFVTAISLFTYRSDEPISPWVMKISEYSIIAWIPFALIGSFILAFRIIYGKIKNRDSNNES